MARKSRLEKLVEDSINILIELGIPVDGLTTVRKRRMAKAFLAVAGLRPELRWTDVSADNKLRSRQILWWMNEHLGEKIKDSSYDDIRRKDLLLPIEAGLVMKSAHKEGAATNDGMRSYALNAELISLLRTFDTQEWQSALLEFMDGRETLDEQLKKRREQQLVPVTVGSTLLQFGPGEHNELQKAVIEQFLPRFGFGAEILYVGDTDEKFKHLETESLKKLGFFAISHDKLPDVLAYAPAKNWLFLIEAVHSANPINEVRKRTLEQLTSSCTAEIIYVTAFLSRVVFRKFARDIAWETEVWIAESPDHLIHFNGDKFLGPHVSPAK